MKMRTLVAPICLRPRERKSLEKNLGNQLTVKIGAVNGNEVEASMHKLLHEQCHPLHTTNLGKQVETRLGALCKEPPRFNLSKYARRPNNKRSILYALNFNFNHRPP